MIFLEFCFGGNILVFNSPKQKFIKTCELNESKSTLEVYTSMCTCRCINVYTCRYTYFHKE